MAYSLRDTLAKNISTAGTFLNLPEMKLSEIVQGVSASPVPYKTPTYTNFSPFNYAQNNVLGTSTSNQLPGLTDSASKPSAGFGQIKPNPNLLSGGLGGNGGAGQAPTGPTEAEKAYLSSLNTQYDRLRSEGQGSLSSLESDTNYAIGQANLGLQGLSSTVDAKKTEAATARDRNIDQAAQTTQNTVRNNRNTLRALGILNSSAAGEMLTRPVNEFDKTRAAYVEDYQKRVGELDNFLLQETSKNKATIDALRNQYNQIKSNIENDLRFNERERADALNAANAAISSRISTVRQAQQTVADRVNAIRNTYDTLIADVASQKALTMDNFNAADYLKNAEIQFNNEFNPSTIGLTPEEQRKRYVQEQLALDQKRKLSQL